MNQIDHCKPDISCRPGKGEIILPIPSDELNPCLVLTNAGMTRDDFCLCIDGKNTGTVRVSVGPVSCFIDVYSFVQFPRSFWDNKATSWVAI